ncbi:helix-hairpin-helix domain-containing protein [Bacillus suaedae]|uniref:Helix-hairpin-helix domain-containing protein n=1 Tax=Halalkalibacter suaedae TaxID=2822140 RepID=A0A941ATB5_9BACI|nr:helix-hairpin-helix domain-containing protein [Bacillus suaedae]MBP3951329.1 helix-hairpin-helix domain-containing protein [Bacillus suaedae]
MIKNIQGEMWKVMLGIAVIIVGILLYLHNQDTDEATTIDWSSSAESLDEGEALDEIETIEEPFIMIDIKGAIQQPNVYQLPRGSRVYEAIKEAGGFTEDADERQLNLAQLLVDEMVVYVPTVGEEGVGEAVAVGQTDTKEEGKIKINTVDETELQQLPGIGPTKAEAIIAYREENGPFKEMNDLLNVSGIGIKSLEKLEGFVVFH